MISRIEFRLACRGLLLLVGFDSGFLRFFDRSVSGALRSFWLAALLLPYEILSTYLVAVTQRLPSMWLFLAADIIGYLLGWILFPLLLLSLERTLDREREMPGCIAVLNWASFIGIVVQLPSLAAVLLGFSEYLVNGLFYAGLVFLVAIETFLIARCLRVLMWQAALLTIADYVIAFALLHLIVALGRVPVPAVG